MKKTRITLDGAVGSARAVEHVVDMTCGHMRFEATLSHVCHGPPCFLEHGGPERPGEEVELDARLHEKLAWWVERSRAWAEERRS